MIEADYDKLKGIFPSERIKVDSAEIRNQTQNTLGLERRISAIVQPINKEEISSLIQFANDHKTPLYPISKGKNIGYGDKLPITEDNIIVDLSRMNKISRLDNEVGTVVIQPGVTQFQLKEYLNYNKSDFIMDATGAGTDASVLGNILEGGFGHTPKGNYIEKIKEVEAFLGNGKKTIVHKDGVGPDLRFMFIQSNFGIVTGMKIELMKKPEHYESFLIKVKEREGLAPLVDTLADLRMRGVIQSQVHISNAVRSYITTQKCPDEFKESVLTSFDVARLTRNDLIKINPWSAIGGLYDSLGEVSAKKRKISNEISKVGKIMYTSDRKLNLIGKIANSSITKRLGKAEELQKAHKTLKYIHELGKGIPSDEAINNIQWRTDSYEDMGLIWYGPMMPAKGRSAAMVMDIGQKQFTEYGFEFPLTLTLVKPDTLVGIISISFDKTDSEEKERAHALYKSLDDKYRRNGIVPYRTGIMRMEDIEYQQSGMNSILHALKKECDPNNIISPGRYGIK